MIILGIESSCDETSAAVLKKVDGAYLPAARLPAGQGRQVQILSNIVASSASMQSNFGGIIPEQAAREQIKSIIPVIKEALQQAAQTCEVKTEDLAGQLDAIAVTYGPGLIGSLLVGVETAKVLARIWNKPLIPVNHLIGHFYANWIENGSSPLRSNNKYSSTKDRFINPHEEVPNFPCLGLLVSGGHTDLVLFKNHGKYEYLGGTRDDAAGECFDKCARLLNLPYPGGPEISKLAEKGRDIYKLPRPMMNSKDFDFSFSGLKTAVANLVKDQEPINSSNHQLMADICASVESAIIDVLVSKTIAAAQKYNIEQIIVAGGVAANLKLSEQLAISVKRNLPRKVRVFIPPPSLCTDNGAMITAAAFFLKPVKNPLTIQADPNLSLAY